MEQQATAEAVCNWTLNLWDPPDGPTNKAALLEREALLRLFIFSWKYWNFDYPSQELEIKHTTKAQGMLALFLLI